MCASWVTSGHMLLHMCVQTPAVTGLPTVPCPPLLLSKSFFTAVSLSVASAAKAYMSISLGSLAFSRTLAQFWLPLTVDCDRLNGVMSAEGPSISFFPTSRRSACDRCCKQKLRCPARENATQSCLRCVRASLPCTTGYIKPL